MKIKIDELQEIVNSEIENLLKEAEGDKPKIDFSKLPIISPKAFLKTQQKKRGPKSGTKYAPRGEESQRELAAKLGISQPSIHRALSGKGDLPLITKRLREKVKSSEELSDWLDVIKTESDAFEYIAEKVIENLESEERAKQSASELSKQPWFRTMVVSALKGAREERDVVIDEAVELFKLLTQYTTELNELVAGNSFNELKYSNLTARIHSLLETLTDFFSTMKQNVKPFSRMQFKQSVQKTAQSPEEIDLEKIGKESEKLRAKELYKEKPKIKQVKTEVPQEKEETEEDED